jgi:2-dehydro-3-deoxyglucarate aldolase/4-hydroxy-2-oxoheptanedioate aldolase
MENTIIPQNKLKRRLREGQACIGTMLVEFRQPSVMQLLANAGFDFVIIDNEHGPFSIETIADLSRAARQLGVTPIVRVSDITYTQITQALDSGAQGIMIPRVTEPQQVVSALNMMKYPPVGKRGSVLARGHTDFKGGSVAEAMTAANQESMLVVQVETLPALECLDEILSITGVDVALVGPNDLSIALGVPDQMQHPKLEAAIERTIAVCNRRGIVPAIHMNDLQLAAMWTGRGMRMISVSSEVGLTMKAGSEAVAAVAKAFTQGNPKS